MAKWLPLKVKELEDWLSSLRGYRNLPTFRVQSPQLTRESVEWSSPRSVFSPQTFMEERLHPESGIREMRFSENVSGFSSDLQSLLRRIAESEDARKINREERDPSGRYIEFETELADLGVDVIGPGGRVILKQMQDQDVHTLEADIVIRRRGQKIESEWRDPGDIARSILQRCGEFAASPPEMLFVQFGYLELSKYESQDWMRSAVMVSFPALAEENELKWTATIAEPVTMAKTLSPIEGLGSFAE